MRLALITAYSADRSALQVTVQPAEPHAVRAEFKRLIADGGAGFAEIHLWESSSGLAARKKFDAGEIGERGVVFGEDEQVFADENAQLLTDLEAVRGQLKEQSVRVDQFLVELKKISDERDAARADFAAAEKLLTEYEARIGDLQKEIDHLRLPPATANDNVVVDPA